MKEGVRESSSEEAGAKKAKKAKKATSSSSIPSSASSSELVDKEESDGEEEPAESEEESDEWLKPERGSEPPLPCMRAKRAGGEAGEEEEAVEWEEEEDSMDWEKMAREASSDDIKVGLSPGKVLGAGLNPQDYYDPYLECGLGFDLDEQAVEACMDTIERETGHRPVGLTADELADWLTLMAERAGEVPRPPSAANVRYRTAVGGVVHAIFRDAALLRSLPQAGRLDSLMAAFIAHLCTDVDEGCKPNPALATALQRELGAAGARGPGGGFPGGALTDEQRGHIWRRVQALAFQLSRVQIQGLQVPACVHA